jgi:P-type conjugative transfer protein TrbJ
MRVNSIRGDRSNKAGLARSRLAALACGLALALSVSVVTPNACATAVIGATEPTQILNHIELIAQYEKQLQQAMTQVQMYVALEQQLKNLPNSARNEIDGVRGSMSGVASGNLASAQQMLAAMQMSQQSLPNIQAQAQNAYNTITYLQARGVNMTPAQYELGMAALAQKHADTYGQVLRNYQQSVAQQQEASRQIQAIAASAPQITSSVGGLQAVVQSNAVLSQQLSNISSSLVQQGAVQAQQAKDEAEKSANEIADQPCQEASMATMLGLPGRQQAIAGCQQALHEQQAAQQGPQR